MYNEVLNYSCISPYPKAFNSSICSLATSIECRSKVQAIYNQIDGRCTRQEPEKIFNLLQQEIFFRFELNLTS